MRNLFFVILFAIFLCADTQVLVAMPADNCFATLLNRDVFQPGESLVVRVLPLACMPINIDLQFVIQRADPLSQKWVDVTRRTARLRGLIEGVPIVVARIEIPDGDWESTFGFYRVRVGFLSAPNANILFVYDETPVFFVGNSGFNVALALSPAERIKIPNLGTALLTENHQLRFTESSNIVALFYQFREDNIVVIHRIVLQRETNGNAVSLPELFWVRMRDGYPIWIHLVDSVSGVATDRQLLLENFR